MVEMTKGPSFGHPATCSVTPSSEAHSRLRFLQYLQTLVHSCTQPELRLWCLLSVPWMGTQQQKVALTLPGTGCRWKFLLTLAHLVFLPCNPGHHSRKTLPMLSPCLACHERLCTLCTNILVSGLNILLQIIQCLCVINTEGFHFQFFCPSHSQDSSSIYCCFSRFTMCPRKPVQLVFQFLWLINFSVTKPGWSLLSGSTILSSCAKLCNRINHTRMNWRTMQEYALLGGLTPEHCFLVSSSSLESCKFS